ncbi:hypothetical protein Poly24_42020 [Rosistilla carotiformis]|uniref:Uncharacterized protein n=1 Tax=Rosistilla carotiformis TaxID=2528017 RepID=A0A518JY59_9BACT|nr:hypothetical protein [Rosistilla carotiformis]QDV70478.1 hypothetical protein Poly24_42020 [Rosistilla carotiformis]
MAFLRAFALLIAPVCASLLGCGRPDPQLPPTVAVSAIVTLDGTPLEEAEITFSPSASGPSSNGRVVAGEVIDVMTNGQKPGVTIGEHVVTIYDRPVEAGGRELVPDSYGRFDGGFHATVKEDGPNEFNFELARD